MKKLLLIIVAILSVAITTAQAKEPFKPRISLGANAILEGGTQFLGMRLNGGNPDNYGIIVRPGISFDVQLSKHSGIETGIYFRQNICYARNITPTGSPDDYRWFPETRTNMLLIPVYYKFYSKILNFAAGADLIFNLNKKTTPSDEKMQYAFALRISKDFNLYKNHLYIEPLIQGSMGNVAWWGVGVGVKYRF